MKLQNPISRRRVKPLNPYFRFEDDEIEQSIPERFEKIVRMYPHRLAVKMGERSLTYDELNRIANRIARAILDKRGPGSEPVALLFEHGIDVIGAIFGVLKAGKFYVAIDPSSPLARIAHILKDFLATLLVTNERNSALARQLAHRDETLLNVDEIDDSLRPDDLGLLAKAEVLATIMYTSGSTGEPKAFAETHGFRLRVTKNHSNLVQVDPEDKLTLVHSVSFASAYVQLFSSLLNGASIWPFDLKNEGVSYFAKWLLNNRITVLHLPPIAFRQLSEHITDPSTYEIVRMIRLSGAPITKYDFDLYKKNWPRQTSLAIHMGSTETGTIAQAIIDERFQFPDQGTPVGYPAPDKKIVLVDVNGQEVGPGQTGELGVKGRYLTAGYLDDFKATSPTVLPHLNGGDERVYMTGDIARMLPDGFLIHVGRKDFTVKIRGYRVELTEIEKALRLHPQVKESGVAAWDREPGEKYLVGYIVARGKPRPAIDELRSFLTLKLPDYMVPSAFIFLETLPLTNGKLDRKALPKPGNKRPELSQDFTPPRNEVEEKLTGVWAAVLGIDRIGIHDNFFDLGGHSLLAAQLFVQIEKVFRKQLPPTTLFWARTVEQLARILENDGWSTPWSLLFPIQVGGTKPPFFWVYGETSDVFLPRYLGPDQPLYGLMHEGRTGKRALHTQLGDIAANHLKELRIVQPEGPYYLGGYCFGGMVAFEMAQQLQKQGQEVALLFLLDLATLKNCKFLLDQDSNRYQPLSKFTALRDKALHHFRNLAVLRPQEQMAYVRVRVEDRVRAVISSGKNIAERVARNVYFLTGRPLPIPLQAHYVSEVDGRAIGDYKPQAYPARIIHVKAEGSAYDFQLVAKLTAGGLESHEVSCRHSDLIKESHIGLWADALKRSLSKAQANTLSRSDYCSVSAARDFQAKAEQF